MADTLSRAYLKNKTTRKHEVQDVININRSRTEHKAEEINVVSYLPLQDTTVKEIQKHTETCLLYTSPSPRDLSTSRMPSSA